MDKYSFITVPLQEAQFIMRALNSKKDSKPLVEEATGNRNGGEKSSKKSDKIKDRKGRKKSSDKKSSKSSKAKKENKKDKKTRKVK